MEQTRFLFGSVFLLLLVLLTFSACQGTESTEPTVTTASHTQAEVTHGSPLTSAPISAEIIRIERAVNDFKTPPTANIFTDFSDYEIFRDTFIAQYFLESDFRNEYTVSHFYQNALAVLFITETNTDTVPYFDSFNADLSSGKLTFTVGSRSPEEVDTALQEYMILITLPKDSVPSDNPSAEIVRLPNETLSQDLFQAIAAPKEALPIAYDMSKSSAHIFVEDEVHAVKDGVIVIDTPQKLASACQRYLNAFIETGVKDFSIYDEAFFETNVLAFALTYHEGASDIALAVNRVAKFENCINIALSRQLINSQENGEEVGNFIAVSAFVTIPRDAIDENTYFHVQLLRTEAVSE